MRPVARRAIAGLTVTLAVASGCTNVGNPRGGGGGTILDPVSGGDRPTSTVAGGQTVNLDPAVILADPATIEIRVDGEAKTATKVWSMRRGDNSIVWLGRTEGSAGTNVVISVVDGQVSLRVDGRNGGEIGRTIDGDVGVKEPVPDGGLDEKTEPPVTVPEPDRPTGPPPPPARPNDQITIDVMVVYNSAVARSLGNSVRADIQNAVDRTNAAHRDSRSGVQLRLVHAAQVPDAEIAAIGTNNIGGVMRSQAVAQLRDRYGADLVQAWGTYRNVCGQGFENNSRGLPAQYGFSVVNNSRQCTHGEAPAHEWGHNLGAGHDRAYKQGSGDAFGYIDTRNNFRTIMAYRNTCARCELSWLFSNPSVSYKGAPAGRAGSEDNVRNIRIYAPIVANYRPTRV
jgi:peptidyl-Asp metalloendopeptidase